MAGAWSPTLSLGGIATSGGISHAKVVDASAPSQRPATMWMALMSISLQVEKIVTLVYTGWRRMSVGAGESNVLYLIAGLVLFLGVHSVSIVSYRWRDAMAARLGPGPWRVLHSLISVAGLALIVYGFGRAREAPVILYVAPIWVRDTMVMVMPVVFPIAFA